MDPDDCVYGVCPRDIHDECATSCHGLFVANHYDEDWK